jgi:hypothetical protein
MLICHLLIPGNMRIRNQKIMPFGKLSKEAAHRLCFHVPKKMSLARIQSYFVACVSLGQGPILQEGKGLQDGFDVRRVANAGQKVHGFFEMIHP